MVSPSTLIRQARATKDKQKAAKLRQQAAALRRKNRRRTVRGIAIAAKRAARIPDSPLPAAAIVATHDEEKGGWGVQPPPLVSTETVERLRKLALKRDGKPDFEIALRSLVIDGKITGRKEAEERHLSNLKGLREVNAINVVCGFMAIIKLAEKANGGALPPTMSFSGYTAAKIYDALRDAGYTENGKDSGFRARR